MTSRHANSLSSSGRCYLVGAGPGDAGLLTLKGLQQIQQADVVVYDRLVSDEVMTLVRRDAERIFVGKRAGHHCVPQEEINQILLQQAQLGKRVVRLKGGDPFIFGRGGEELEALVAHGISFEVVPGITAASGVSSYAGIPLTHRDYAQRCMFVAGHLKNGTTDLDWSAMVRPQQTVVIYMGLGGLPYISRSMLEHGASPDLPIAVVQYGTIATQKVVTGTLATIVQKVQEAHLQSPCLTIVGDVVRLHHTLAWFK